MSRLPRARRLFDAAKINLDIVDLNDDPGERARQLRAIAGDLHAAWECIYLESEDAERQART